MSMGQNRDCFYSRVHARQVNYSVVPGDPFSISTWCFSREWQPLGRAYCFLQGADRIQIK
jgi:hypothetical protein